MNVIVTILVRDLPEIVPGPQELVALGDDHPGALIVEAKMAFDGRGDFDGGARPGGRTVRDRQHRDDRRAVLLALNAQDDHARAIFKPFVLASLVLSAPKVGIGND